jgi:8-oxo-dGTP pyrophosphatase MutT (NUDIX family)
MTGVPAPSTLLDAAVLVPVYRDALGALRLVMVLRSPHGIHGNQIGLPGGRPEPEDDGLLATALREAEEEIGLSRTAVEILAPLPDVVVTASGYRIWPFLGRLRERPPVWVPQEREVAEVLDIPIDALADPAARGEESWQLPGWAGPRTVPFIRIGTHNLWGATHRIVLPLLPRLAAGEWQV